MDAARVDGVISPFQPPDPGPPAADELTGIVSVRQTRLLIVEGGSGIDAELRAILGPGAAGARAGTPTFELVCQAADAAPARPAGGDRPFPVAFVDAGPAAAGSMASARRILASDPDVQVVLCVASDDRGWREAVRALVPSDRVLVLRRPFEPIEVQQLTRGLIHKWVLACQSDAQHTWLEATIEVRTADLAAVNDELRTDIERRQVVESALAASERRFRALAARAPVGIFEASPDGFWTYANERSLEIIDGTAGAEDCITLLTSIHPDDAAKVRAAWNRSLAEQVELASEHRYLGADGQTSWAEVTALPERDAAGKLTGWIGSISDISERKLREMQLTLADRLTSMGTLAAGLAHEINNPLAYLSANLDMAMEHLDSGDEELAEMLADAREGAGRVRQLVSQLKSFSRVDEAETRAPVPLVPLIEASLKITANQIRHRAELTCDYGTIPPVLGDEGRLAQVIVNLLVNATQALPEDRSDNEIRVATHTATNGDAVIEVRDNGVGIPPANLSRIFDPFFTTKRVGEGTGLGLSICHNIITTHGGRLEVESTPGSGTTFRIVLPAMAVSAAVSIRGAVGGPRAARVARVLIVDDEPHVAAALKRILRGHEVDVVRGGAEALTMLERFSYDVVLCDVMMPGMSGVQLFAHIERSFPAIASRVIFITGGAFTPETQAFLESVQNERLPKPFDVAELRRLVSRQAGRAEAVA